MSFFLRYISIHFLTHTHIHTFRASFWRTFRSDRVYNPWFDKPLYMLFRCQYMILQPI